MGVVVIALIVGVVGVGVSRWLRDADQTLEFSGDVDRFMALTEQSTIESEAPYDREVEGIRVVCDVRVIIVDGVAGRHSCLAARIADASDVFIVPRSTATPPGFQLADPAFADLSLTGPPRRLMACLDRTARRRLLRAIETRKVRVEAGWIVMPIPKAAPKAFLDNAERQLVRLARDLSRDGDDRLRQIALEDHPAIAAAALAAIESTAIAQTTAAEILAHHDDARTLVAAHLVGASAAPAVARMAASGSVGLDDRRAAFQWLARVAPAAGEALAIPALEYDELRRFALQLLARAGATVPLETLQRFTPDVRDMGPAGFELVARHGAAGEPLLASLVLEGEPTVARQAIDMLGAVGTATCMPALRTALGSELPTAHRRAAQTALSAIGARIGLEGGALSVSEAAPDGRLTLDERGGLSRPTETGG